jgi:hypothetical protein
MRRAIVFEVFSLSLALDLGRTGQLFFKQSLLGPYRLFGVHGVVTVLLGRLALLVAMAFHIRSAHESLAHSHHMTRFLRVYDRMESLLKKRARAHKYKNNLSNAEIDAIIARHIPRLKSIQIFNFGPKTEWPEVTDEYYEQEERIVQEVKADLQKEFIKKIKLPKNSTSEMALNHYLSSI